MPYTANVPWKPAHTAVGPVTVRVHGWDLTINAENIKTANAMLRLGVDIKDFDTKISIISYDDI
jgi:hypothetical protein